MAFLYLSLSPLRVYWFLALECAALVLKYFYDGHISSKAIAVKSPKALYDNCLNAGPGEGLGAKVCFARDRLGGERTHGSLKLMVWCWVGGHEKHRKLQKCGPTELLQMWCIPAQYVRGRTGLIFTVFFAGWHSFLSWVCPKNMPWCKVWEKTIAPREKRRRTGGGGGLGYFKSLLFCCKVHYLYDLWHGSRSVRR